MTTDSIKPPVWYWVATGLALLWNIAGVANYLTQAFATPEMIATMPEYQHEYMANTPAWVTGAFALAVWGGTIGCLLLLLRKRLSQTVLTISLVGIVAQVSYNLFFANISDFGPGGVFLPITIVVIGAALLYLSKKAKSSGWIR